MQVPVRIIPKIDIKGPNLVKGVNLEGLRVLGNPAFFAKRYYQDGADELIFQDVVASLYGRNSLYEIIKKTADEIFIPLTVGGGIRSIGDIKTILRAGADKVSINTFAHENPEFLSEASNTFGSSTIVVGIEAIKQQNGDYLAFTDNGRNGTGKEVVKWCEYVEKKGAGEILLTSVDKDGTGSGMDLSLIEKVCNCVNIPVVVNGGIGNIQNIKNVLENSKVSGLAISSILHYDIVLKENTFNKQSSEGNMNFLQNKRSILNLETMTLQHLKNKLIKYNFNIRN